MAYKYRTSFTAAAQADREEPIVDGRFSSDGTQYIADLEKINIGTGNDLQIYHDSNSYIKDAGDGYLQVSTNGSGVYFVKSDGSSLASFIADGSCELFEAGQLKLETTAAGVKMPSSTYFQFDAASSNAWAIGATTGADLPAGEGIALQYHHWNNAAWDKVSFKTRDGVGVPNDKKFMAGDSSDLEIYHESSGSNGMIFNKTGDLYIQGNNGSGAAQTAIQIHSNEGVDLKFAGLGPKLSTLTNGVAITGEAIITQSGATGGGYFNLAVKNTNASNDYSLIYFQSTDTGSSTSSAAAIRSNFAADDSSANGRFEIRTRKAGTLETGLTLDENQNATFAGKVKLSAGNNDNYLYLINTTASDADSARYSRMLFQGTQSGGEVSSLAAINGAHDGTGDDEKGVLTFRTNDGNDSESPTVRVTIDSDGNTTFTENIILSKMKKVSFRDSGTQKAYIEIDSNNDVVYYGVSGTEHKFYANALPAVDINHEGIKINGARGIQFSNYGAEEDPDNAATDVTSNTLDDYEEGTWVPAMNQGADNGSGSAPNYSLRGGHYTKIGNKVYAEFFIYFGNPSESTGQMYKVGNLPFDSKNADYVRGGGCSTYASIPTGGGGTNAVMSFYGSSNSTEVQVYQGSTQVIGTDGQNLNGTYLIGFYEYITP